MKKPLSFAVASVAIMMGLAGCASEKPRSTSATTAAETTQTATPTETSEPVACPPTPLNVTIEYELKADGDGGIIVYASTNLPADTDLQASFYSPTTRFFAQDPQTVTAGKATFGPFADHGAPLKGGFDFSITAPIARNQPLTVQQCIGHAGERLTGPLVKKEEITGDYYASIDEPVVIP